METEIWRGILKFRPFDVTHTGAVAQFLAACLPICNLAITSLHPTFAPNYSKCFRYTIAEQAIPQSYHSAVLIPSSGDSSVLNLNWPWEAGVIPPSPSSASSPTIDLTTIGGLTSVRAGPTGSVGCQALVNHNHECNAPANLLPALPISVLSPAPAASGIEYTGPSPSFVLNQRMNDDVDAPVLLEHWN